MVKQKLNINGIVAAMFPSVGGKVSPLRHGQLLNVGDF